LEVKFRGNDKGLNFAKDFFGKVSYTTTASRA
jgi:hypothetical protein